MTESTLSIQLYAVREALADDLDGTLARLAELGFTQVEAYDIMRLDGLAAGLTAAGLTTPTAHQRFVGEEQEPVFERAAALGVEILFDPSIPHERWQSADVIKRIADDLGTAAEKAAGYGLQVGYHNHDFEFEAQFDGRSAYELFASHLPDAVVLELDTYWAAIGGADPVALLEQLGPKVVALHLKDGPGTREPGTQLALGSGSMPIRELIEAAPHALRVLELDDSRDDRFQATADSVAFLVREGLL